MSIVKTALLAATLFVPLQAVGASIALNPGLWETTMTRTNPMTGTPTTETTTECVQEKSFDPREMMQDASGCSLTNESLAGDTLTFAMACDVEGAGTATIEGRFQTDGETGAGDMKMNMNMGGMTMSMDMNWTARRLGDC
jgi:hypothetical protein